MCFFIIQKSLFAFILLLCPYALLNYIFSQLYVNGKI